MMDKLLPLRANGVTLPGGYSPRRFTTTASRRRAIRGAFTIAVATLALLGGAGVYHALTAPLPAASAPSSAPSSAPPLSSVPLSLPPTGPSAPVAAAQEAPPAATHIVEAEAPPSARPQAAEPPQATTVDAAAGAAPQPPPYPLLGPVRKVVSEVGAPPAFDGHGELGTHPGVSCVVSDIYRFIYIIVHKAGSQTTRAYLMNSLCGTRGAADAPDSNCTTPLLNFRDTHARYTPCKNVPRSKFANYYVFSHTRNVWARAVSTYSFCRMGRAAGISWAAWCADPDTHRDCFRSGGEAAAGVVERGGPPPTVRGTNEHWGPQLPRLCTPTGECWVDYVGRSEGIDVHLNAVIDAINARRDAGLAPLPRYVNRVINARRGAAPPAAWYLPRSALSAADAAAAEAAGVTPEPSCRAAIGRYYAADVAAFGSTFEDMAAWGAVSGGGA